MENSKPIDYSIPKPVEECQKRAEICSVPPHPESNAPETCFCMPHQLTYYNNKHVQNPMTSYTSDVIYMTSYKSSAPGPRSDTPPADPSALHNYSTAYSHLQPLNAFKSMLPGQGDGPQPPQLPSVGSLQCRPTCKCPNCAEIDRLGPAGMHLKNCNNNCHIPGCGKAFGRTSDLKVHLRCHSFVCDWTYCGKRFKRSAELECHLRTHTGEKRFACRICSKLFIRSDRLSYHEKMHIGKKRFACKICSKRFTRSDSLFRHTKTHTAEKPFTCKICSKRFTRSDNLSRHAKTHIALKDRKKTGFSSGKCSDTVDSQPEPLNLVSPLTLGGPGAPLGQPQHPEVTAKSDQSSHP